MKVHAEALDPPALMPPRFPLPAPAVMPAVQSWHCTDRANNVTFVTFSHQCRCKSTTAHDSMVPPSAVDEQNTSLAPVVDKQ
jgi:hypothetical protein